MKAVGRHLHFDRAGLRAADGSFSIDPSRKVPVALVSHAHGDHAIPGHGVVYATRSTWELMKERYSDKLVADFREVEFGRPFRVGPMTITYYPAGHILGSAQILLEQEGVRYLYTGDFKVHDDPTCEPFHHVKCDYLITETTFAHPDYSHPDAGEELASLCDAEGRLVIGAYAVGKAQRITRLLHDYAPGRTVYVHPLIGGYHRVYETAGVHLGEWRPYSRKEFLEDERGVLILPPSVFSRYERHQGAIKVFATGWKRSYYRCDRVLSISDHADWDGLMKVISSSGAHTIFTLHGDGTMLRDRLIGSGPNVELLEHRAGEQKT
jgi:putative mRNA 3-end processing factor